MLPIESTCSSNTGVSGQQRRCVDRLHPLSRFLGSFETTRKSAKQMIGYSKTEHPFSRIRSTCSFNDTNFEAFEVTFDSGTRGTFSPGLSPGPHGPAARISAIGTVYWPVPLECGRSWGTNQPGGAGDDLSNQPWASQIPRLRIRNSRGSHVFHRPTKGISTFSLQKTLQI